MNVGIELPKQYVTQKCAILGVTGSGKSYGAGAIIEEFLKANIPFVLLDVMGAHYGLSEKFDILIYGGSKGHPLDPKAGELFAEAIFDIDSSIIFDVSHWNDFETQEFIGSFLQKLFNLHSHDKKPRHIFIEEAEVVFPQTGFDNSRQSLLAGNKIMKRGRSFGLGMTLITQRPQDVNKKTLSQSQCTFILHMEGIQELEVINKMLRNEPNKSDLLDDILKFQTGDCLLYSPAWLKRIEKFKFRERETYHAGDTPELGTKMIEPQLKLMQPLNIKNPPQQEGVVGMPNSDGSLTEEFKLNELVTDRMLISIGIIFAILTGFALGWF